MVGVVEAYAKDLGGRRQRRQQLDRVEVDFRAGEQGAARREKALVSGGNKAGQAAGIAGVRDGDPVEAAVALRGGQALDGSLPICRKTHGCSPLTGSDRLPRLSPETLSASIKSICQ